MIATADLHINRYKRFDVNGSRLKVCLDVLDFLFEEADKDDGTLLIAGDLFDSFEMLYSEVVNAVVNRLKQLWYKYPEVEVIATSGNHDQGSKNLPHKPAITSLEYLSKIFDKFHLIDNAVIRTGDVRIFGVPYYEYPEHFYAAVESFGAESGFSTQILMIHQNLKGSIPQWDIDPGHSCFEPFDLVLSGHVHRYTKINRKFYMIGNPLHRDFGDEGDKKYILRIDEELRVKKIATNFPEFKYADEEEEGFYTAPRLKRPEIIGKEQDFSNIQDPPNILNKYIKELGKPKEYLDQGISYL